VKTAARNRQAPGLLRHVAALMVATIGTASAGAADEAQALAERAAAHVGAVGHERAFADFSRSDGGFVHDGIYVFCFDRGGVSLAHGGNPKLVGKTLTRVRDPDGNLATGEMGRVWAQGRLWVDYRWPNPATRQIEAKSSYLIRIDDRTACGATYYKTRAATGDGSP
jgi:signal transduction histidine kinase